MDAVFIEGVAGFIAALIIFPGSVFLLMSLVMGARLAYFVTASVTLCFILIMCVVWSINQLGPVGELPNWLRTDIGEDQSALDFGPAAQYPEGPWQAIDKEDQAQVTQASELETAAQDELEIAIEEGDIKTFEAVEDATPNQDLTRLLEQDGDQFGMVTLEPIDEGEGEPVLVVMEYDPGNPLGMARMMTAGTFVLLVIHLFFLSRAERKVRELRANVP